MSDILKGIISIWSRLFDHRSFLNGEIQFILREFEVVSSDQEVEQLFQIIENITEIKDTQINKVETNIDRIFPQLRIDLDETLGLCKNIDNLEEQYKNNNTLKSQRERRKLEWQCFIDGVSSNCLNVDNTCQEAKNQLQTLYENLGSKLYLETP